MYKNKNIKPKRQFMLEPQNLEEFEDLTNQLENFFTLKPVYNKTNPVLKRVKCKNCSKIVYIDQTNNTVQRHTSKDTCMCKNPIIEKN